MLFVPTQNQDIWNFHSSLTLNLILFSQLTDFEFDFVSQLTDFEVDFAEPVGRGHVFYRSAHTIIYYTVLFNISYFSTKFVTRPLKWNSNSARSAIRAELKSC